MAAALLTACVSPTRSGVRLLSPGDAMMPITSFSELKPDASGADKVPKVDAIRVAVEGGDASLLSGLTPLAAPFEIVAPSGGPDLVWDPGSRQARYKGEIIAYDVTRDDLPAVVDRMALARDLARRAAQRPQSIRLAGAGPIQRKGDRVELELGDMLRRALVLLVVGGDGAVDVLYPLGADARIIETPAFRWTFQVREPFGTDLVVAVTAAQPMATLERGVKELSHYRGAGELLKLIALAAPPDARIGVAALRSQP